jgi:DNA-binding transcriptional regulator WhiA
MKSKFNKTLIKRYKLTMKDPQLMIEELDNKINIKHSKSNSMVFLKKINPIMMALLDLV